MQSVQASILEYIYQFSIAQSTQERLNEIAYTVFLTSVTTAISLALSYGYSAISAKISSSMMSTWTCAEQGVSDVFYQNLAQDLFGLTSAATKATSTLGNIFKLVKPAIAIGSEVSEELFIDPWIEAYVSGLVAKAGGDAFEQIYWSTLAESGRESGFSMITTTIRGLVAPSQVHVSGNLDSTYQNTLLDLHHIQEEMRSQQESMTHEIAESVLSSILLLVGILGSGTLGSLGAGFGNVIISLGTSTETLDSIKDIYRAMLKKKQIIAPNNYLSERITDSLWERVAINNILQNLVSLDQNGKPIATYEMIDKIKQIIPYGFNGYYDSGLGALNFFAEHGFSVDKEAFVYAGGMSNNPDENLDHIDQETLSDEELDWIIDADMEAQKEFQKEILRNSLNMRGKYILDQYEKGNLKESVLLMRKKSVNYRVFDIISKDTLKATEKCSFCNLHAVLKNPGIHRSRAFMSNRELMKLYNKHLKSKANVHVIYRVTLHKTWLKYFSKKGTPYLAFPGLSYIGQAVSMNREFNGLITEALNPDAEKRGVRFIAEAIRWYSGEYALPLKEARKMARKLFKVKIWQVCDSQEEANIAEIFWIARFKSQNDKYGFNLEPGGKHSSGSSVGTLSPFWIDIPFNLLDALLQESIHIRMNAKPEEWVRNIFKILGYDVSKGTLTSKIRFYYKDKGGFNSYQEVRDYYTKEFIYSHLYNFKKPKEISRLLYKFNPPSTASILTAISSNPDKQGLIQRLLGGKYTDIHYKILEERIINEIKHGAVSGRDIAKRLGLSHGTVNKYIKEQMKTTVEGLQVIYFKPILITFAQFQVPSSILDDYLSTDINKLSLYFWGKSYEDIVSFTSTRYLGFDNLDLDFLN